jgi:hypothetical protein
MPYHYALHLIFQQHSLSFSPLFLATTMISGLKNIHIHVTHILRHQNGHQSPSKLLPLVSVHFDDFTHFVPRPQMVHNRPHPSIQLYLPFIHHGTWHPIIDWGQSRFGRPGDNKHGTCLLRHCPMFVWLSIGYTTLRIHQATQAIHQTIKAIHFRPKRLINWVATQSLYFHFERSCLFPFLFVRIFIPPVPHGV